jgi:hypothetical protein
MSHHSEGLGVAHLKGQELVERLSEIIERQNDRISKLEASLELLRIYQENSDILLHANEVITAKAPELASSYSICADQHFSRADGFHSLEFNDHGRPYRWCGEAGNLTFRFYVDRSQPLIVTLELFSAVHPDNIHGLELFEKSDSLPLIVVEDHKPWPHIVCTLPPMPNVSGATVLRYNFPVTQQLSEQDGRVASVAMHRFSVETPELE